MKKKATLPEGFELEKYNLKNCSDARIIDMLDKRRMFAQYAYIKLENINNEQEKQKAKEYYQSEFISNIIPNYESDKPNHKYISQPSMQHLTIYDLWALLCDIETEQPEIFEKIIKYFNSKDLVKKLELSADEKNTELLNEIFDKAYFTCNMFNTDKNIEKDFSKWLKKHRQNQGDGKIIAINSKEAKELREGMIIPYIDLLIWQYISDNSFTFEELEEILYSEGYVSDKVRRTLHPKAEKYLKDKILSSIIA